MAAHVASVGLRLRRAFRGARQRTWRGRLAVSRWSNRRPRRPPIVGVIGPAWFVDLFRPEFHVIEQDAVAAADASGSARPQIVIAARALELNPWPAVPTVGYRCDQPLVVDPAPFVQPHSMNPTARSKTRSAVELAPPDLVSTWAAARRAVAAPQPTRRRPDRIEAWLEQTAVAHPIYRAAHQRTSADVVEEAMALTARQRLAHPADVTVLCVTNRPGNIDRLIANFERQRHPARLLVVTNSAAFDRDGVENRLAGIPGADYLHTDEHASLGAGLNAGLERIATRYVAKFDDDDHYGPEFLGDMLIAHRFADAAIVGKHSHFARFLDDGSTHLRFPGREFEYTSWLAGGTMVIDCERAAGIRFRDRSIGEDGEFLADCQRAGLAVFAADRFNYMQRRGDENTWSVGREEYLRRSVPVASDLESTVDR